MKFAVLLSAALFASPAFAETPSPETDACKASGSIALKQKSPQVKDVQIDLDSARVTNADAKIEDVPVRTVVIAEAYVEKEGRTSRRLWSASSGKRARFC